MRVFACVFVPWFRPCSSMCVACVVVLVLPWFRPCLCVCIFVVVLVVVPVLVPWSGPGAVCESLRASSSHGSFHVDPLLLYGAQCEYQSFVPKLYSHNMRSLCRRALSRRLSTTHLLLWRISGSNVPCCEVVEGAVHSNYRMEIVTCGSESKRMNFWQRERMYIVLSSDDI